MDVCSIISLSTPFSPYEDCVRLFKKHALAEEKNYIKGQVLYVKPGPI